MGSGPEALVDLLKTDALSAQALAEEDQALAPADGPLPADTAYLVVAGILDVGQGLGVRPDRGLVALLRAVQIQTFVRALAVVLPAEPVEVPLLSMEALAGRVVSALSVRCMRS